MIDTTIYDSSGNILDTLNGDIPENWKSSQGIAGYVDIGSSATSIGNGAFQNNQLTSVTIPNSVTSIGGSAFSYNQLTSVTIPNSVTNIGSYAFYYNYITSVTIPNSVTSIGSWAFSYNQLQSVTIPNSVTSIGNGAFQNNQLTSVTIPNSVTNIGSWAFSYNQLQSVTIPNSVTSIGDYAFSYNQLQSVTIPNSVTNIGYYAFGNNQLQSVTIPNSMTSIGSYAFYYNRLTSVTIPNSVTSIGSYAFCRNPLTSVTIPNSVTNIGDYAFSYNQLQSVTIPNSVTNIGNRAFYNNQLQSVTIPNSVTNIGVCAFGHNQQLNTVNCYASQTDLQENDIFQNTASPLTIHVRATDESWTAGTGLSFQGNSNVTVIKDLVDITDGLQAFYKLSDLSDSSGNNRTLTNNGNVSFASGKIGNAAVFDGSNYLNRESIGINSSGPVSFSAWVKHNSADGVNALVYTGQNGDNAGFGIYGGAAHGNGEAGVTMFVPGNSTYKSISFQSNIWCHVVMINDTDTQTYKMYFNGVLVDSGSNGYGSNGPDGLLIGTSSQRQNGNGSIDAVGIWNRALSDSEVAALYNSGRGGEVVEGVWTPVEPYYIDGVETTLDSNGSGFWNSKAYYNGSEQPTGWNGYFYYINNAQTGLSSSGNGVWNGYNYSNGVQGNAISLTDGLQAFYKLSDLSDSSGNNRTLTNNGNVSFASGKIGNAAVFDGSNYLDIQGSSFSYEGLTFSAWVYFNDIDNAYGIFGGSNDSNLFIINQQLCFTPELGFVNNYAFDESNTSQVQAGVWQHLVGRWDNATGEWAVFVNNTKTSIETGNTNLSFSFENLTVGCYLDGGTSPGGLINGSIDAVGIWNRALSDAEVAALYNNGTGLELPAGPAVKNGWIDNIFWINDVATTLDSTGSGTWLSKVYENGSLFSGTKYELTFVDGVAQPVQIVTVTGNNVPVAFGLNEQSEPLVALVFANITSAGETTVEQIVPTVIPAGIPAEYTVAQTVLAYSIDTTATFEGTINVDFILPSNISQTVFNRVKAFHVKNNGTSEEMTRVSSDFATKKITVAITSFSSFLFLDEPPQQSNKSAKISGKTKFVGKVKFA